jgi:hypothetical protein
MFMKKTSLFSLLSFLLVFAACKKDSTSSSNPTPVSIAGIYKVTALSAQIGNSQPQDLTSQLTECSKSSTWGFQDNGSFFFGGAATQTCTDPDYSGTWSLSGKTLTITTSQGTNTYQIVSQQGRTLVLSTNGTYNGANATLSITYAKQ